MRINEVIRLLLTEWETTCPNKEKNQPHTDKGRLRKRTAAWDRLIGLDKDGVGAAKVIIKIFVSTGDDRNLVKETLGSCRRADDISHGELDYLLQAVDAT